MNKDYVKIPELPPYDRDVKTTATPTTPMPTEALETRARALASAVATLPEAVMIEDVLRAARFIATGSIPGDDNDA